MSGRYFEDFKRGDRFETAAATIDEGEMIEFARRYDPQSFHLDAEAAKRSIFGELVGSGFLTMAMTWRLFFATGVLGEANLGSPGFEEVRFTKPVRPGDALRVAVEVVEARPSATRPDRGVVRFQYRTYNQRGEEVMSYLCRQFLKRRTASN